MFRFEGFCEDKNLAKLMHAVNGIALNFTVVPAVNAKANGGKVVAETDGSIPELFKAHAKKVRWLNLTKEELVDFQVNVLERKATGYPNLRKILLAAKVLKKSGTGPSTTYKVI